MVQKQRKQTKLNNKANILAYVLTCYVRWSWGFSDPRPSLPVWCALSRSLPPSSAPFRCVRYSTLLWPFKVHFQHPQWFYLPLVPCHSIATLDFIGPRFAPPEACLVGFLYSSHVALLGTSPPNVVKVLLSLHTHWLARLLCSGVDCRDLFISVWYIFWPSAGFDYIRRTNQEFEVRFLLLAPTLLASVTNKRFLFVGSSWYDFRPESFFLEIVLRRSVLRRSYVLDLGATLF